MKTATKTLSITGRRRQWGDAVAARQERVIRRTIVIRFAAMRFHVRLFAFTLLLLTGATYAQNISSGLSGTLHDPSGAVVPGAEVRIESDNNGFVRTQKTNNSGFFSFPDLTPATFTLTIVAPGFKAWRETQIQLNSSETRDLGIIRLATGEVSETVTITAEAVPINITTGDRSQSMSGAEIDRLALRGRDIFDAVGLMAGVVDTSDGRESPGPGSIGNIFIAGARNDQKNMTIDGITNLDTGSNGSVHSMPSASSVSELKVMISNYSAEYGRNSGGTITVITKGGQKQFHGQGDWYYRHEDLNANDYFNNLAGRDRTPYRYNIGGYSVGGPILIPRMASLRHRLFFFFSQEFQHQRVAYGTRTITVPTALERQGDFTRSLDVNNKLIPIYDPEDGRRQFPGNIVPATRITQIGRNILNIFPQPNYVDPSPSRVNQWNYFTSEANAYPRRTEILRVDFSPRNNWQLYVRASQNADSQNSPYGLWVNGSLNFNLTPIVFAQPGRGLTVHSTNTLTTRMFNEFIAGVSQNTLTYAPEDSAKVDRTALGINIPQRNPLLNPANTIPNMTFGSIANAANPSLSDGNPYFNRNTIYSFVDNVSWVLSTHTLKAGLYVEQTRKVQFASTATRGTIKFDRDGNNSLDANNAYANALLGNYDSYAEATSRPLGDFRFSNTEFYVQDTWKATRRLSLDYGLRFYHDPPQYDQKLQLHSFLASLYDPAKAPILLRPGFDANKVKVAVDPRTGQTFSPGLIGNFAPNGGDPAIAMFAGGVGDYPKGLFTIPALLVSPRFGFAYDPFGKGKTAIRGGGGIFFDRLQGNPTMDTLANPPAVFTPTNFYGAIKDLGAAVSSGLLAPTGTVYSLGGRGRATSVYNYSFSVQQQVLRQTFVEVSYVGALNRHLVWRRNINAVPLGANFLAIHPEDKDPTTTNSALPPNFLRPYQGYGDIWLYEFAGTSNYNSLQTSLSQRFKRGSVNVAYTFSKALDESDSYSNAVDPFYSPRARNYGPAGFDRTHVFSANYNYALPNLKKPGVRWVTDNWSMSGVTRFISGAPFTPTYALVNYIDYAGSPSASVRPQVRDASADVQHMFGPPVFSAANVPTLGNVGKNTLHGPGTNNWDLSLYKNLAFREDRVKAQLRFESYNTFNHTQFSAIDQSLKFDSAGNQVNGLFMQPTAARAPRRIQLAMRLTF